MHPYNILIGYCDESNLKGLAAALEQMGHRVVGTASSRAELVQLCIAEPPQLVISSAEYSDGDAIEALIEISKHVTVPGLVIAKKESIYKIEEAMDSPVMAYLISPVTHLDLTPAIEVAIRRFNQLRDLQSQNAALREELDSRKKLERAKGILMARFNMTEEDAYLKIRNAATSRRVKMAKIADTIITGQLENVG